MHLYPQRTKGFLLIQLLVVIGIIGILASVILGNLGQARARARDKQRTSDFQQIQIALRQFRDAYDRFPSSADGNCAYSSSTLSGGCLNVLVTKGYLPKLPTDPQGKVYNYDNWCRTPSAGADDQYYRAWVQSEVSHTGDPAVWWDNTYIGIKVDKCLDAS